MKKRLAIVRGPYLNSWEMQNFSPLIDTFDIVGFASYGHNFNVGEIPFEVKKLFSFGQSLQLRLLRKPMIHLLGDLHDLQGLGNALRGFDIVHSAETASYYTYQAAKVKEQLKFKLVVTVWENIPFLHHLPATERCKKVVFEKTDLFLAVSERAKEVLILEGVPERKIKIQMPGIDTKHFFPMPKDPELLNRFGCSKDDVIVLYVANLYREKGIYDLLFAFKQLLNRSGSSEKIKLLIAGKGRERDKILRWIRYLKMEDCVKLVGSHSYNVMPKIHNLADIFILPSLPISTWQEQFGYVLIESMACGKPVISTMSGSIPEVVENAGILVQPNDFLSLMEAMENLIRDEQKRNEFGQRGRRRAEKYFDAIMVAQQFKNHYESLL
jgi:glycosyltransferase involved in cell wall biosynthesis